MLQRNCTSYLWIAQLSVDCFLGPSCWQHPHLPFSHPSTDDMTQRDLIWFWKADALCFAIDAQCLTASETHWVTNNSKLLLLRAWSQGKKHTIWRVFSVIEVSCSLCQSLLACTSLGPTMNKLIMTSQVEFSLTWDQPVTTTSTRQWLFYVGGFINTVNIIWKVWICLCSHVNMWTFTLEVGYF